MYVTAGIYSIVFGNIFISVKSRDLNYQLCGLELNDILIQQDFNFIGKESGYYTEEDKYIYSKGFNCEHSDP